MMFLGACPLCSAAQRGVWLRRPELTVWLCEGCGLGYSDPQPREIVERRYLLELDLAAHFGNLEQRKEVLITRRLDRLPASRAGQRLLDVGCADGQFAAAAQRRGWSAHGVELNPPAAQRARERGVTVYEGPLEDACPPEASYDLVTAWDVIEHVPDPRQFVEHLVRLVAPGGTVVVSTLNRRALVARVFKSKWSMVAADHFTYWDTGSLARAFETSGMRAVRSSSFGLGRDFVAWIDRWRSRAVRPVTVEQDQAGDAVHRSGWDAGPIVLAAERALNRVLDVTALGVGIEIVLRAP